MFSPRARLKKFRFHPFDQEEVAFSWWASVNPTVRALRGTHRGLEFPFGILLWPKQERRLWLQEGGSQCAYTRGYSKHEPTPESSQTSLGDGYSEVIFKYSTKQPFLIHEVTSKLLFRGSPTERNNFLLHLHFCNILFMTTFWHLTHLF